MNTENYRIFKMSFGFGRDKWHVVEPVKPGYVPLTIEYSSFKEAMADLNAPWRSKQEG